MPRHQVGGVPQEGEVSPMKTLAIRLEDEQHARLSILAKLSELSVTDAIRQAIEAQIERMASSPDIAAKASEFQDAITREADEQRAAIQALFGTVGTTSAPSGADDKPKTATARGKGTS